MPNRKDKKSVHISKDLHKAIELWKVESDDINTIEEGIEELIRSGFESKKEELPDYIISKLRDINAKN